MIITKISGGLGNQMFQYATGRSVSLQAKTALKLDVSGYAEDKFGRHYSLDVFTINATLASLQEVQKLKTEENFLTKRSPRLLRLVNGLTNTYINEEYNEGIIPARRIWLYLDGYWQNEKYFIDYADEIRRDFRLKESFSPQANMLLKKIKSSNSVSIHIRRGDYARITRIRKAVGICGFNYFQKAINFILNRVNNPVFYIFSEADGLEWARSRLKIKYPMIYINGKDYEDLLLMSACKHTITANSSFSWWGAWLNANPQKIVIVPDPWFNHKNTGIVPRGWFRIAK